MEREQILIISHSYTPFLNPRAFRWSAIAEHWSLQGKDVDVICSWLPGLKRFELVKGVDVHRVGSSIIESLRVWLRPKSRSTTATSPKELEKSRGSIFTPLAKWVFTLAKFFNDKIWKNLYWPDYACLWIAPAAAKALELCEMEKYGTVISVSDPFSSHLVGKAVKLQYPDVNWLVDIGDPFCFRHDNPTNNHTLFKKLNYRKERELFARADRISVTNINTLQKYSELFPGSSEKIKVIAPIMTGSEQLVDLKRALPDNENVKLVYVGTLYRSIRNPEHLLKIFKGLLSTHGKMNVELHFFGGFDACRKVIEPYKLLFADKLVVHGLVNREKVLKAMTEADILINIGNDNAYQLPSKLVEYTCLGKPIVNLYSIDKDSSKEFLEGYPALLNLDTRPTSSLEEQVRKLANFIGSLPMTISTAFLDNWQKHFDTETIANEYAKLIENKPQHQQVAV